MGSRSWSRQQRPGSQDAVRIEGGLDPAQHARPGRTEIGRQQAALQPSDAVMMAGTRLAGREGNGDVLLALLGLDRIDGGDCGTGRSHRGDVMIPAAGQAADWHLGPVRPAS